MVSSRSHSEFKKGKGMAICIQMTTRVPEVIQGRGGESPERGIQGAGGESRAPLNDYLYSA